MLGCYGTTLFSRRPCLLAWCPHPSGHGGHDWVACLTQPACLPAGLCGLVGLHVSLH